MTRLVRTSGVVGLLAGLAGCAPEAASFDSREPNARLEASFRAVETKDTKSVNQLIRMLSSDDSAERLVAIRSLERLTGQTLGYHHEDPQDERDAAIDRWVAWAKEQPPDQKSGSTQGMGETNVAVAGWVTGQVEGAQAKAR